MDDAELEALLSGRHAEPHRVLGPHAVDGGWQVRVMDPAAVGGEVRCADGRRARLEPREGLLVAALAEAPGRYALGLEGDGRTWERGDPYAFGPTLGEQDLASLIGGGKHRRLWEALGARLEHEGVAGWSFTLWAPNARRVSLVGDFCAWDGRSAAGARRVGVWELFLPWELEGSFYKCELLAADGALLLRATPWPARPGFPQATRRARSCRGARPVTDDAWLARQAAGRAAGGATAGLQGPPRDLGAHAGLLGLPAARRPRRPPAPLRVHPTSSSCRCSSTRSRLVGLPGHRLLRADEPLRRPRQATGPRRPLPRARPPA
ncbi:MAG: hypothetical protein R3F30_04805 [Planctomycetota bacterium]